MDKVLLDQLWAELVRERMGKAAFAREAERAEQRERVEEEKATRFDSIVRIMRGVIRHGWWRPGEY